ncbi:hypothetical protein ACLOJK_000447, partial [Asimina triloba]
MSDFVRSLHKDGRPHHLPRPRARVLHVRSACPEERPHVVLHTCRNAPEALAELPSETEDVPQWISPLDLVGCSSGRPSSVGPAELTVLIFGEVGGLYGTGDQRSGTVGACSSSSLRARVP